MTADMKGFSPPTAVANYKTQAGIKQLFSIKNDFVMFLKDELFTFLSQPLAVGDFFYFSCTFFVLPET